MKRFFALLLACTVALAALPPAVPAAPTVTSPGTTAVYDLNAVTVDELVTIRGIGPVLAERIIEYRTSHGPFTSVEELLEVKGIGEKSFEKLRASFTLTAPPSPVASTSQPAP